jgi:hypothetical protein
MDSAANAGLTSGSIYLRGFRSTGKAQRGIRILANDAGDN